LTGQLPTVLASTNGRRSDEEWKDFFSQFDTIVLVANSEEQQVCDLSPGATNHTLFVFFNKVDRVLEQPLHANAILVARSNQAGSELVYRGILDDMIGLLPAPFFRGVINLRTVAFERLNEPDEFGGIAAGFMDLAPFCASFYPARHTASSGFALAVWLCKHVPTAKIRLTGFSALRGPRWKLFHIHDWTFEQTTLLLLKTTGRIGDATNERERNPYPSLVALFPELNVEDATSCAIQVLSQRLEKANQQIDQLLSITSPLRLFYAAFRKIKRKSKKDRILQARQLTLK
jgi:hypothetical protein